MTRALESRLTRLESAARDLQGAAPRPVLVPLGMDAPQIATWRARNPNGIVCHVRDCRKAS